MAAEALCIRGLYAGYGGSQVLHGVSLTVHEGETALVVGPNGHGKSTLAATISGMHLSTAGTITFMGKSLDGLSPRERLRHGVAHVPQGDLLFLGMTVADTLYAAAAYSGAVWRERHARMEKVFAVFPSLARRTKSHANQLSGGERRMLAIGRALMASWQLLIIDEPSLGLAPIVIEEIYNKIHEIRSAGQSIILIDESLTHAEIANRVITLREGRVGAEFDAAGISQDKSLMQSYLVGV